MHFPGWCALRSPPLAGPVLPPQEYASQPCWPYDNHVSNDVRDRLKVQADRADRTLGEHLAHLAGLGDREHRPEVTLTGAAALRSVG